MDSHWDSGVVSLFPARKSHTDRAYITYPSPYPGLAEIAGGRQARLCHCVCRLLKLGRRPSKRWLRGRGWWLPGLFAFLRLAFSIDARMLCYLPVPLLVGLQDKREVRALLTGH